MATPYLADATNLLGSLSADVQARIEAYCAAPTQEGWTGVCNLIIRKRGLVTIWKAIRRVDTSFQTARASGAPWATIPSAFTVRRAIQMALAE